MRGCEVQAEQPRTHQVYRDSSNSLLERRPRCRRNSAYAIDVYYASDVEYFMVIKETSVFTKQVRALLDTESYRLLQLRLCADPGAGAVIPGTGGLRKIRWQGSGRGKRGGVRAIYYWAVNDEQILMLLMYPKNERDDLTADQKRVLVALVKEEFK